MRQHKLLGLVVFLGLATSAGRAADLASVVPEDVFLYAEVTDPAGLWADFEQSALRDVIRVAPQLEFPLRLWTALVPQLALQRFGIRWNDFVAKYGSRFALVIADPPGPAKPSVCLLLDASDAKAALVKLLKESVEPTLRGNHPEAVLADERHQGVPLRIIKAAGENAGYAFLDGVLTVGRPAALKKLIDGRARQQLAANKAFAKVRKKLAVKKGLVAYFNLGRVLADNKAQLDANLELARFLDDLGVTGIHWIAMSSAFEERDIRDRVYVHTGPRKVGLIGLLTSLSPGASKAATVLPKECPILASLTFKDGPELWQAMLKYLEEGGEVERLARLDQDKQQVMLRFGINFDDDFVGALGGELFLAANPDFVTEYVAKRRTPPRNDLPFIIGLRVARPEALKATVHRFIVSQPVMGQGVERKVQAYQGIETSMLTLPGSELKPAYAFVGDYLLIAKSEGIIRKCIDAKAAEAGLSAEPQYRGCLEKMPRKHNAVLYADLQRVLAAAAKGPQRQAPPPPPKGPRPPVKPRERIVRMLSQTGGLCATMAAEKEGILIEARSRTGLASLLAAALYATVRARRGPPAGGPRPPKQTDF